MSWHHDTGLEVGNDWENGYPSHWYWSRPGGSYRGGSDFFCLHWEVCYPKNGESNEVRLHVEAPTELTDAALNGIKLRLVAALLETDLVAQAVALGYEARPGRLLAEQHLRANKSSEVMRVLMKPLQRRLSYTDAMRAVHDDLGAAVEKVLERFVPSLREWFAR